MMGKIFALLVILIISSECLLSQPPGVTAIYLSENFESGVTPQFWHNEFVSNTIEWKYRDGGYQLGGLDVPNANNPPSAFQGDYNAVFFYSSSNPYITKLVSPEIELNYAQHAEIHFWHAQVRNLVTLGVDGLKVYYKKDDLSPWVFLKEYSGEYPNWQKEVIVLPSDQLSDTYRIAFEGINNRGMGACIDSVLVVELIEIPREIVDVSISQVNDNSVRTESLNNPISKVSINVIGNEGDISISNLSFTSSCDNNSNINTNGVWLYYSPTNDFANANKIATPSSIVDNKVVFNGVNIDLETGVNYLWIAADIASDAEHGNKVGFYLEANSILTSDAITYPVSNESYSVTKTINKSILFDDFETDKGWVLSGEWERGAPLGLGGMFGNPDPNYAISGNNIMGVDLSGLNLNSGDYEAGLSNDAYLAVSPTIDAKFYIDVHINFFKQLNIDQKDTTTIQLSTDNGVTWRTVWTSSDLDFDKGWKYFDIDISEYADRQEFLKVRFNLGPSDGSQEYSGWNIDDFAVTGIFLTKDLGIEEIIKPLSGCGHTATDTIRVKIKNYAYYPSPSNATVKFWIDNSTFIEEIIPLSIPSLGTLEYTFVNTVDLSSIMSYPNSKIEVILDGDLDSANDQLNTPFYTVPTFSLPYFTSFEEYNTFWYTKVDNPLWEIGIPQGYTINKAFEGERACVTNLSGAYSDNQTEYIESPCFSFVDSYYPIIEFNLWKHSEIDVDGLNIEYSVDNGTTWNVLDNDELYDDYWNWYTDDYIPTLLADGFSGETTDYITVRHFIPDVLKTEPCVKFRLVFKSNGSDCVREGFAIDNFKVYEAPAAVKLMSITEPSSNCYLTDNESVTAEFKNSWFTAIPTGDSIVLALSVNSIVQAQDTIVMQSDLAVDDLMTHTFVDKVDFSADGEYDLIAYSVNNPSYGFYQIESLDSTQKTLSIYNPVVDLGPDIYTARPDTIILDAFNINTVSYKWNDNVGDNLPTYSLSSAGTNFVEVSRNGCLKTDTIVTIKLIRDVGMVQVISPISDCSFSATESATIQIKNYGTDTIKAGQKLKISYRLLPSSGYVDSELLLDSDFVPEQIIDYTLPQTFDLSDMSPDKYLGFKAIALVGDEVSANDAFEYNFQAFGYPNYSYSVDTLTIVGTETTLDAGAGWNTYLWNTGETQQIINTDIYGWHKVTISDEHSCHSSDSVFLNLRYADIMPDSITAPIPKCEFDDPENITFQIVNNGSDTIWVGDKIQIIYKIDGLEVGSDEITLTENFYSNQRINHTSEDAFIIQNIPATISVETKLVGKTDDHSENNIKTMQLNSLKIGLLDLGTKISTTNYPFILDAGSFKTYLWNTGSTEQTIEIVNSGIYSATVVDDNNCVSNDTVEIEILTVDLSPEIISPVTGCAEENNRVIVVKITNSGNLDLTSGTIIPIKITIDGTSFTENITTENDIATGQSAEFTLVSTLDLSQIKTYSLQIETMLATDYNSANNLSSASIVIYPLPVVDLGDDKLINGNEIVLDAGSFDNYLWSTGATTQTITVNSAGIYSVIATDTNNCSATDSITINQVTIDLAISEIKFPVDGCNKTSNEFLVIKVENQGLEPIYAGTTLYFSAYVNNSLVIDNVPYIFFNNFEPSKSFLFQFGNTIDLSNIGNHKISTVVNYSFDQNASNDTLTKVITNGNIPVFSLGDDIVAYSNVILDAGSWSSYWWSTGSTDQQIEVSQTGTYYVTVTNQLGCSVTDDIYIQFKVLELEIVDIASPSGVLCLNSLDEGQKLAVEVKNIGEVDFIKNDIVVLSQKVNENNAVVESVYIPENIKVGETSILSFQTPLFAEKEGQNIITLSCNATKKAESSKVFTLYVHQNPLFSFDQDSIEAKLPYRLTSPIEAEKYFWQPTDSTSKSLYVFDEGYYKLIVTEENGCMASDSVYIKDIGVSLSDIVIWPNPTVNNITVFTPSDNVSDVLIINTLGKVYKPYFSQNKRLLYIETSNLPQGHYNLLLFSDTKRVNVGFVKL